MIYKLSCEGMNHAINNQGNQDAVCSKTLGDYMVISLADGVGSCAEAQTGADVACEAVTSLLAEKGEWFFRFDEKRIAELILEHVQYEIKKTAREENKPPEEYASTIASVIFDKRRRRLLCFNLGDGIIIGTENSKCKILSMPFESEDGCCVTMTENAVSETNAQIMKSNQIESVIICSDGAWKHFFSRYRLTPQIKQMLIMQDYDALGGFLRHQECSDDYSFIAMELLSA